MATDWEAIGQGVGACGVFLTAMWAVVRGQKKSDGKPALNSDLWDELLTLISKHSLNIVWLKGHAGHPENERCDSMAVRESHKFIK